MTRFFKTSLLLLAFANATMDLCAQADAENKVVTLTVVGQGNTQDAARQSALRNAIEQAFGTFISSRTEVLNDQLIKDEIVSVSSGNIQAFEVLSEVEIPGGGYSSSLKATVSISRLTSFVESKGVEVEFKGGLFAMNIKQQLLNEESEVKAMLGLVDVMKQISDKSFDFFIAAGEPTADGNQWKIPLTVTIKPNANLSLIPEYLRKVLSGLAMSTDEVDNYRKLNKPCYSVVMRRTGRSGYDVYTLRSQGSLRTLSGAIAYFAHSLQAFAINDGLSARSLKDFSRDTPVNAYRCGSTIREYMDNFRPALSEMGCATSLIGGKSLCNRDDGLRIYDKGGTISNFIINNPCVEGTTSCPYYRPGRPPEDRRLLWTRRLEYFPNLSTLRDMESALGAMAMFLQFQELTNNDGIAATYGLLDHKALSDLGRVTGYTISIAP